MAAVGRGWAAVSCGSTDISPQSFRGAGAVRLAESPGGIDGKEKLGQREENCKYRRTGICSEFVQ